MQKANSQKEMDLIVEKLVYGGYGLARSQDKIIMVENAYPQEHVKVIPKKTGKNLMFAEVKEIIKPSTYRIQPNCNHFPTCGGCNWLDLKYEQQLIAKTNIVKEQTERIGKISNFYVKDIIGSEIICEYRNRMEYTFQFDQKNQEFKLGLMQNDSKNVVDLQKCLISPHIFNKIRNQTKDFFQKLNLEIYSDRKNRGVLKYLVLRKSFSFNQIMVIIVTHTEYLPFQKEITDFFRENFKIYSLIHLMNSSKNIVLRGPYKTLYGEGLIQEQFDNFKFQIPPTSFFQSNYNVTKKLLGYLLDYFKDRVSYSDTLLDLFSGVGLFSIYFSSLFKEIESIENSKVSYKAAIANSHINAIKNIRFYHDTVENFVNNSVDKKFDYIILDPPRKGISQNEINKISSIVKKAVVYVSCDPSTLLRDINAFLSNGLKLKVIQPFDMFPHSFHIENVAILEKNN
ncbi:23S rRNA (uracil(1939)-C(5))-methyltransferase RlmD [Petrotoga sp. 9PWA.NaAc.5.4]|uniref:23S rRNA (uracil(1939)-C(5))-methyltransferase RlmD n=1 Tax=Petrotoga sp. 9PWA.NaAc.5.4 TaxID=1434328 RepID=UPI000CAD1B53|nr:23S rRNA (uracil(1939)-C(5))-methyltransferase RlmD [Petrotoga sp. 9PWA.NaAc.5.4]PNR97029.1 RNA methyltransferase [Petrotoga sp. 9PWA.NaAc.5.4]